MDPQNAPKFNFYIINYLKERRLKANFEPVAIEEILQILKDNKLHVDDDAFTQWLKSKILSDNPRIGVSEDNRYMFKPVYDIRNGKDLLQLLSDVYPGGVRLLDIESALPNSKKILEKEVFKKEIVFITGGNKEKIAFLSDKVQVQVDMKEFMIPWRDAMNLTMDDIEIVEYLKKKKLQPFLKEHSHSLEDLLSWVHKVPDILKELVQSTVRAFYSIEEIILIDVLIQNPGMNEMDVCNLLKFDEKLLRGRMDKLAREKFVVCRSEMVAVTGKKPHCKSFWYINYKSFVNMLNYKLLKIKKLVQTSKQTDNSVMTMALFHQKFGQIHSLLKECEKIKLLPPSFYHGLYRSVPVPDNEHQIQEYLHSKGIQIMQYEVTPSKRGRKAGKAKKATEDKDYSGADEELKPPAAKKDVNKLKELAQLMGATFLNYEDCRFLHLLAEHTCLSEEDCAVLLSVTKRGFVKMFKEMKQSHPFLSSGKYDLGADAVDGKPKKINVFYIDYIVLVNTLQMCIHMMREKIPSGYVELFEETVQPMLSLLDRVKDLKFSTNTVPKPTNLKGNQVADFEGPSKQDTSEGHGSDSEEEVGDSTARQSASKREKEKVAEKEKSDQSGSDEEPKPTAVKRRKQTTSKNPTATGS